MKCAICGYFNQDNAIFCSDCGSKFKTVPPDRPSPDPPPQGKTLRGFLVSYNYFRDGEYWPLYEGKNIIGRDSRCDVVIAYDATLSSEHFVVMIREGTIKIRDNCSQNLTMVNRLKLWGEAVDVLDGDLIGAGKHVFVLVMVPTEL